MTFMVDQISQLEQQLAEARQEIEVLTRPTEREIHMAKRIEEQQWEINQLKNQKNIACLQIDKNENTLDKYEKQIENLEKQLAESKKSAYIYSDQNLDRLDSIIEKQITQIEEFQDHVNDYQLVIRELECYIDEADMKIEHLEDQVKEYDSQADFEDAQIREQKTIIDKLEDTIEKQENSIRNLESKLEKHDTEIKQKTYHILELQAHIQEGTTLEKLLSETFVAQYKNGLRLAFIYGQLEINGHFRDVEKIDLANSKDWRMSFRISANSEKENLLMPYNNQLDDINFSKAVKLIKDAAATIDLYVGDYSPKWIEVILNNLMHDHSLIRDCYLDVVTRHYVNRFRGVENLYTWHQIGKFKFAIPRDCEWDTKDIVKMFKHHIKN